MPILVKTLLECAAPEDGNQVVRVLHIDVNRDLAYVIQIDRANALPESRLLSELEYDLARNKIWVLTADPYAYLLTREESIPEKHRLLRDAAWALIEPIVTAPNSGAFDSNIRGKLVAEAANKKSGCKNHIYRYLRRYWQGGLTPNGLRPHFHLCGAPGKRKKTGKRKRGRQRQLTKLRNAPAGININPEMADKLIKGYRLFYEKAPEAGGVTKRKAYDLTLQTYFHEGFKSINGVMVPVLPKSWKLPTYEQFIYWAKKIPDVKDSLIRRHGERKFNLKSRAVLGDSTQMANGPGSHFQIDSTISDLWIVSSLDPSRRLGRPVVYFVVDTFSHMIAGVYAGLENASFFAAGLAMENATVDKVAYCAQFGIKISPEQWPSCGLPESILADRGELEGYGASNLVQSLGIRVANTPSFRADLKGIVERTFRSMNDLFIHDLPGAVRKPKERGERDPRLDAVLTLQEFRVLLIHAILQHNSRRLESYRLQKNMITDGIEPRPVALWTWGITNRSGHLRTADAAIIRANLLPGAKATITFRGIKFRGLVYGCDRVQIEGWFEKARASRTWQVEVAYDPRLVDNIFLRMSDGCLLEPCQLLKADHRFLGASWADVADFFLSQKQAQESSRTDDLQSRVNLQVQVDSVVKKASEAAKAANRGLSKSTRLGNVRENRDHERRLDATVTATQSALEVATIHTSGSNDGLPISDGSNGNEYIPPPCPLEMLRQQRDKNWRIHE